MCSIVGIRGRGAAFSRALCIYVIALGALFSLFLERVAHAQGVCIDDKAKHALDSCGAFGAVDFNVTQHGGAPQLNVHGVAPVSDLKKKDDAKKPPAPPSEGPRDPRLFRLNARKIGLLEVEIQNLEQLFLVTTRGANDRSTIARRLAEDYVELESIAFHDKTVAEIARDAAKRNDPARAGQLQTQANTADAMVKNARQKATTYYTLVKTDYPDYPELDAVLYYLAYEYEQGSDNANARKIYYELIQKRPDSKYVPNAYLAFGELFFNEAQGDPAKFDLAAKAYLEVIKYPPPNNKVFGYAHYKLAYVFWNEGDYTHAMNEFKKTIDFGVAYAQLPGATKTAENARRDIIPVYALAGDPDRAFTFFKPMSGDPPGSNDKTFKMMDDLGLNYLDTGHYPEGIALYRDLLNRDRGGVKNCMYQAHITEATMAMRSSNKDAIVTELENQLRVHRDFRASDKSADAKAECANKTASLITETAMEWHQEAVGTQNQRGTGDKKTMTLATALYKRASETWKKEEFAQFTFPRLVREDWPTTYKIKYGLADLLYVEERWAECGPAFEAVVDENPSSKEAAEAAYAAVLCYQKLFDAEHAHGEARRGAGNMPGEHTQHPAREDAEAHLRPKDMSDGQKNMVRAFDRYVCTIKPAASDSAGQAQLCEVKYARARTYFEAQHWEEAAAAFRDIAEKPCDADAGIYAAQLYLESANILASHGATPRTACFAEMRADVPKFQELYCNGAGAQKNPDQCKNLSIVGVDLIRKEAEAKIAHADKSQGPAALTEYEDGGNMFFDLFRNFCQQPVTEGREPQAERCDEIGYNAAKAFQAARLLAKAISARKALIELDAHMSLHSPIAKKATYEIGLNYQAIAVYELASEWFEKYQKSDARADKADQALSDAVLLRLGLGEEDQAIEDARTFTRAYGAQKPKEAAQVAYAVGAHYAEKEDWAHAHTQLSQAMGIIDRAASADVQVEAHATLGRANAHLRGSDAQARSEYARVRNLWRDPADAEAKIRAAYPSEGAEQQEKHIRHALTAVGEAYFYAAEEARHASVDPLKFPAYRGPGTKADVEAHVNTRVKDWYLKKMAAIQKVEPEYVKILDLKPVSFKSTAPPKWVIAAGSRSGLMWGDFVDDFRRSPIPVAWKGTILEQVYTHGIDEASEPYKVKHAKPALKKCLDLSVEFQYFDEFSRACEVWLGKNYHAEYHVVDELRSAPTLANTGLDERAPPAPYRAPTKP